jgi:YfiH family protein
MRLAPRLPEGVRVLSEVPDGLGLHILEEWTERVPWVIHGVTDRAADMGLFGRSEVGAVVERWQRLRERLNCTSIVHARQVHRSRILVHDDPSAGLVIGPDADGHITRRAGVLMAVTIADCVPISIIADRPRVAALLHGGWRGVAAGILERGVALLRELHSVEPAALSVHLGPAICGECFEVGPEVPEGLALDEPDATHVDLRAELARRAAALGVTPARISVSGFCTRHGDSPFFSHRGGCAERQVTVLAVRDA